MLGSIRVLGFRAKPLLATSENGDGDPGEATGELNETFVGKCPATPNLAHAYGGALHFKPLVWFVPTPTTDEPPIWI